jgi:hypothetical protein
VAVDGLPVTSVSVPTRDSPHLRIGGNRLARFAFPGSSTFRPPGDPAGDCSHRRAAAGGSRQRRSARVADVNGDGFADFVVQVRSASLTLTTGLVEVPLQGTVPINHQGTKTSRFVGGSAAATAR